MTNDLHGKRIALYARFSTDKQNPTSAADQIAKLTRWARERGGVIDPAFVFSDEGVSGASLDRPGVLAMERATARGHVDVVLIEDLSRLSRDTEHSAGFRKRLAFNGVRLLTIDDGIDSEREGSETLAGMFAVFKAQQRADVAKHTRRGLEAKARAGMNTGGLPYGYRSEPCDGGQRVIVDADRAATVRRIFDAYAGGASLRTLAETLNADRVDPPRGSRTKGAGSWQVTTIRALLRHEKYRGRWSYGERKWRRDPIKGATRTPRRRAAALVTVERPDLAIVDAATWQTVQERLADVAATFRHNRGGPDRPRRREYLLSGLLYCGTCGARLQVTGGDETRRYYACSAAGTRGTCENRISIRESIVRDRFLDQVRARLGGMTREIAATIREGLATWGEESNRERKALRARIAKHEDRVANLTNAIADGPSAALAKLLRQEESELAAARAMLAGLPSAPAAEPPTVAEVTAAVLSLADLGDEPREGREALRRMLDGERITLEPRDGRYVLRAGVWPEALFAPEGGPSIRRIAGAGFEPTTFGL